ncbi:MAG: hypothetical protein AVO33_09470 [delta proteobacterium ML8_F1]|nr:MAG: hypothetical protein AVO33_09470 [delta proteobacterium ML8_F1]
MKSLLLFRKDLRAGDHKGLKHLIDNQRESILLYVEDPQDRLLKSRGYAIRRGLLSRLNRRLGQKIHFERGDTYTILDQYVKDFGVGEIVLQRQYEPWEVALQEKLKSLNVRVVLVEDYLLLPPEGGMKSDGTLYLVFKAFYENWLKKITPEGPCTYDSSQLKTLWVKDAPVEEAPNPLDYPAIDDFFMNGVASYATRGDDFTLEGTSRVSALLNNGGISPRKLWYLGRISDAFIRQAAFREYYIHWMYYYPEVLQKNFKRVDYPWSSSREDFLKWQRAETGYDLVDAAMTQLNEEGWIHGRLRMVAASFLIKDLHIDWRWGEAYFYEKLNDADTALNVGNWQWMAGTGALHQPYFRVMSPLAQKEKYDPDGTYCSRFLKAVHEPMVDHKISRQLFIENFKIAQEQSKKNEA